MLFYLGTELTEGHNRGIVLVELMDEATSDAPAVSSLQNYGGILRNMIAINGHGPSRDALCESDSNKTSKSLLL